MATCETCGDEVSRVFCHRIRTESMTHRRTRRVCAACHPALPNADERLVTDGGTQTSASAEACPTCSGTTIATLDGAMTCVDCGWTESS